MKIMDINGDLKKKVYCGGVEMKALKLALQLANISLV